MTELDSRLAEMRAAPLPDGLDAIEAQVFTGIAAPREATLARRGLVLAGIVSLVVGVSGGMFARCRTERHFERRVPDGEPCWVRTSDLLIKS